MQQNTELDYEAALRASLWGHERKETLSIAQQERASDRDRRFRYVLAVLAFIVSTFAVCCSRPPAGGPRDVVDQYAASVAIRVRCEGASLGSLTISAPSEFSRGSGVVVSRTQILTAEHVTDLSRLPVTGCVLYAHLRDGTRYQLALERSWPAQDVARLRVVGELELSIAPPLEVARPPAAGEDVCIAPTYPDRRHRCGEVQLEVGPPDADVIHTAITEKGNSGSGAYDRRGRLVGIVTQLWNCNNGQICGGALSSIRREFLP